MIGNPGVQKKSYVLLDVVVRSADELLVQQIKRCEPRDRIHAESARGLK